MLSMELRRVIIRNYNKGMGVKEISRMLCVSPSAIYALIRRVEETGSIEPGSKGRCGRPSSISPEQKKRIEQLVIDHPDITLEEIRDKLRLPIKKSQISNLLREMGFCIKKDPSRRRTKPAGTHAGTR